MDLSRAVYSRELKIAAMRALDAGGTGGAVARKYQVSPKLLERWRGEWRAKGELVFPGVGRRGVDLPAVDEACTEADLSALAEHKVRQAEERLLAGSGWRLPVLACEGERVAVHDLGFIKRFGNPFDASTVAHRFQDLLTRAGIGHHRFHDLRHTAATLLAVQGAHPRTIQATLGWENISMLKRYAHFVEEQRQAVATTMDAIWLLIRNGGRP